MTARTTRGRPFYLGVGILWPIAPVLIAFLFDPPDTWGKFAEGLAVSWMVQIISTAAVFLALWLGGLVLGPRVGLSMPGPARLFFWTSLIVSPLSLIYFAY